jgi:hypothetical protein
MTYGERVVRMSAHVWEAARAAYEQSERRSARIRATNARLLTLLREREMLSQHPGRRR